jgi:hypothetical protein
LLPRKKLWSLVRQSFNLKLSKRKDEAILQREDASGFFYTICKQRSFITAWRMVESTIRASLELLAEGRLRQIANCILHGVNLSRSGDKIFNPAIKRVSQLCRRNDHLCPGGPR